MTDRLAAFLTDWLILFNNSKVKMTSKIQALTRHRVSHLPMPPSFLFLLCTLHRWKQCLLVTETWQIRGRVQEKPFIKKLELTGVCFGFFFFCSVAGSWAYSFCWLCVHFEVRVWEPGDWSYCPQRVTCNSLLQTDTQTFPLGNLRRPPSLLLSVMFPFCCWRLSAAACWQPI